MTFAGQEMLDPTKVPLAPFGFEWQNFALRITK
jgi:hypothetical protein